MTPGPIHVNAVLVFEKSLAALALVLFGLTWRLWTPQAVFPQVPLFGGAREVPVVLEWLAALGLAGSLVAALVARKEGLLGNAAWGGFLATVVFLIVIDQQRLQAWTYHFIGTGLALAALSPERAFPLLRLWTQSIYVFSALSKCDASFVASTGPQLVGTLLGFLGIAFENWPAWLRTATVLSLPAGELLIVIGLSFRRLRKFAVAAAVTMHLLLILALGPWGLRHGPAVLVWNVFFIVQVVILFGLPVQLASSKDPPTENAWRRFMPKNLPTGAVEGLLWLLFVLPLGHPWGWCDTWPAWALYAPCNERSEVLIQEADLSRLPGPLRERFIEWPDDAGGYARLRVDRWVLSELAVPVYPQNRLQLGVAEALARRFRFEHPLRVVQHGPADRWTRARSQTTLVGVDEITAAGERYWLNSHPRDNLYQFAR